MVLAIVAQLEAAVEARVRRCALCRLQGTRSVLGTDRHALPAVVTASYNLTRSSALTAVLR